MREIKFRGKLINSGKWAYGNLCIRKTGTVIITPDETVLGTYGKVNPDTIGQYTGLKDKNGKEIYEGDIIYVNPEDEVAFILWDEETARYIIQFKGWCADFDNYYGKELEVIGNIYNNPELLEEKE